MRVRIKLCHVENFIIVFDLLGSAVRLIVLFMFFEYLQNVNILDRLELLDVHDDDYKITCQEKQIIFLLRFEKLDV